MSKLPDINYALMAQLSYLHWNNIESKKRITHQPIKTILLTDTILSQIKTDFYDNPYHYPSNETIAGKPGKLEQYTYHEEDKREIIQNKFFPPELLKGYEESGFFGVAFQRGNDIMIAYRRTEFELAFARDMETDFNIYIKKTDIQLNIT